MTWLADTAAGAIRGGFVSIGNFDGVHRGHQALVRQLVARAEAASVPAIVLTFDPPPIAILRPEATPPQLSTPARKRELLLKYGVDEVVFCPASRDLLALTPQEFFDQLVIGELDAQGLVEGPNFFFGRDRAGDVHTLRELCEAAGLTLDIVEPQRADSGEETLVSSSLLRKMIAAGDVADAVEAMGHPYRIEGIVSAGEGRGRTIGLPTANLAGIPTLLPADGVYAGSSEIEGTRYPVALNVGGNPTFGTAEVKVEAHLIDFEGDLYDRPLAVDLLTRLRDVRSFASVDDLIMQVRHDIERTRSVVADAK